MPQPPKKRAPVDTVALKQTISGQMADAEGKMKNSVALERAGHTDMGANDYVSATESYAKASKSMKTLDSARAGQIPATPAAPKRPVNRTDSGAPIHAPDPDE